MPLFLLRDGSIQRCSVVPEDLTTVPYTDRNGHEILILLDARSERRLLEAQPPRPRRRTGRPPRHGDDHSLLMAA
ncbi:MAG: hypothetical protein ACOVNL_09425 [Prochlorococcaceae cyanobacterium]